MRQEGGTTRALELEDRHGHPWEVGGDRVGEALMRLIAEDTEQHDDPMAPCASPVRDEINLLHPP